MDKVLLIVSILVPIVAGITQLAKQYIGQKYHALIPVVVGLVLGPLYTPFVDGVSLAFLFWAGGLAGLAAGGFYSVQNVRNK